MLYKERLQKLVGNRDPFWIDTIDHFIEATYENKEQGISDLEELAKDRTKFNEFTKQIIQRKDDLKSVKAEFLENIKSNYIKNINSIKHIIISERLYNGKYGKGSIFHKFFDFTLAGNKAVIKTYLKFCVDVKIKDLATLEASIPFIMSEEEILKINEILDNIKSNYQVYDKKEKTFSPEYLQYTDVNIDGVNYALKSGIFGGIISYDDNLSKLIELIRCDNSARAISNAYDYLTK